MTYDVEVINTKLHLHFPFCYSPLIEKLRNQPSLLRQYPDNDSPSGLIFALLAFSNPYVLFVTGIRSASARA
jgi:hypothetical protein